MKSFSRPIAFLAAALLWLCVYPTLDVRWSVEAASSLNPPETNRSGTLASPPASSESRVMIPGPLRSFLRMAGISQQVPPEDVLSNLARNTNMLGYVGETQTEFLRLLNRYLTQARQLQILAGKDETIRVADCADATELLKVLGYRLRDGCGQKDRVLETAYPSRAFLTIDSGFPLADLEEALQKNVPFTYPYAASWVPVLFDETDWVGLSWDRKGVFGTAVDVLANDRAAARLYWALARTDAETSLALKQSLGLRRMLPFAATMDFYGSQIRIRAGRVPVPGGSAAEQGWKELVGASPGSPGEFVSHLLARDNGWLAAYFDALSRTSLAQQEHLTEMPRLRRFYEAFRAPDYTASATKGAFRKVPDLMVLCTRLQWEPDGQIHVPGGLDAWKQVLRQKSDSKIAREWNKHTGSWDKPEQLLEAMAAFSRIETDSGPVQIYLMLGELDSGRPVGKRLSVETVTLLASHYSQLSDWYRIFTEFPELSDESIARFVKVADGLDRVSNQALRGNALGAFQANAGLWQIFARQGQIPREQLDSSWQKVMEPFAGIASQTQLFDVTRASLGAVMAAATGKASRAPNGIQEEIVDLLGGPTQESRDGQQVHLEMANRIRSVLNDQRLVSLDTLFALGDGLEAMAQGKPAGDRLLALAGELRDFEMPRQIFTQNEKVEWAPNQSNSRHAELQAKTDLTKVIAGPSSPAQLQAARGNLASLLRDTLVGLNYAYYEPPGSQILHINPLFVRSHDFLGVTVMGADRLWQAPRILGAGVSAGGGAYLMGSLADLPYSLATAEQDLIAPEHIQALIWKELSPELLADAAETRWWNVSSNELHAVALYQRSGEELLRAAVKDATLRDKVTGILSERMEPQQLVRVEHAMLREDDLPAALARIVPADTYYLAVGFRQKFPGEAAALGQANRQLDDLAKSSPADATWERISKDFGVPHPTMAYTNAHELLNVKPFPFFGGYSSRLFSESWESSNLYWARLADEMGYSPVALNRLVPELTRRMTAKIFASDLEDWPSMLRAMQETGEELRQGKIAALPAEKTTSSLERTVLDGIAH
jgi:hypothetical protein